MTVFSRWLVAAAVMTIAAMPAWCFPTLYGDTGLIQVPTADVMRVMNLDLGLHYTQVGSGAGSTQAIPVNMAYGISESTELSATISQTIGGSGHGFSVIGGGMKMGLVTENLYSGTPGIAVGARVFNLRNANLRFDCVDAYAAMSKSVISTGDLVTTGFVIRAHGGLQFLSYSGQMAGQFVMPFVGMSFRHTNGSAVAIDYLPALTNNGNTFRYSTISATIRHKLSDDFTLEVGMTQPYGIAPNPTIYVTLMNHFGMKLDRDQHEPVLF